MPTLDDLKGVLHRIDGRGYKAYKDARGRYDARDFTLSIDHVQGDPFATPSRVSVHLPPRAHGIPDDAWRSRPRRIGLEAFLLTAFRDACARLPRGRGSGKSGRIDVTAGGPAILERSGCALTSDGLTLRFRVGLPAQGRRVLGREAARILAEHVPRAVDAVRWARVDADAAVAWATTTEDHAHLQDALADAGLVAFVRDGSVLPRASGVAPGPLPDAVPFESPDALRVTLTAPNAGEVTGLGVPRGVTVVTGGGFHGKTTLLEAIEHGVYPHAPGDGREWVVTVPDAAKVRSEDGRAVTGVDLSAFVHDLPGGRDTARFTTEDASGSTSLAASIVEALEVGTDLLLLDEDTCATNLLVRDARMQDLVTHEPLTPFIDRVRELAERGVSTLIVTGGSGDYLDVADTVLLMDAYRPREVTERAREVAKRHPTGRAIGDPAHALTVRDREVDTRALDPRTRRGRSRVRARGTRAIELGEETIDVGLVEQLVEDGQARAVGAMLARAHALGGTRTLRDVTARVVDEARERGLHALEASPELAMPRVLEVAAALNRYRGLVARPE